MHSQLYTHTHDEPWLDLSLDNTVELGIIKERIDEMRTKARYKILDVSRRSTETTTHYTAMRRDISSS